MKQVSNTLSLILIVLLISSVHVYQQSHAIDSEDQKQTIQNYGYWFDSTIQRYQEFIPSHTELTGFDIKLSKNGNPGAVLISINSTQGKIWNTTIPDAEVSTGWLNISIPSSLGVIPGESYLLIVTSDTVSSSSTNRYFWNGNAGSDYIGDTDVSGSSPDFDYNFVTHGKFKDKPQYPDTRHEGDNYGFWFDNETTHWQSFIPEMPQIGEIELKLNKNGNPGHVLVSVNDTNKAIFLGLINYTDTFTGWVSLKLDTPVDVTPGNTYKLIVAASNRSTSSTDRYFWRGHQTSTYTQGTTDISGSWPDFDFAFKINSYNKLFHEDQSQKSDNYGFWFDDVASRWQSFYPVHTTISQVKIKINRNGNPGNLMIEIQDSSNNPLMVQTVAEMNTYSGWLNITLDSPVTVEPGKLHYLTVRSDQDSTSASDRYFWRGHTASNYTLGTTSQSGSWSDFDYSFILSSYYHKYYQDQVQNAVNYGFWFDDTQIRTQEFVPTHATLSRLDLKINKIGNPGDLNVELRSATGKRIWNSTIPGTEINSIWVHIYLNRVVQLTRGQRYTITVSANQSSTDTANRYFWMGHTEANYTQGYSDIKDSWPNFDYGFVTWSNTMYLDHSQRESKNKYWFDNTLHHWQEFIPRHTLLSELGINIDKTGNPGSVILHLNDSKGNDIWNKELLGSQTSSGWIKVHLDNPIDVVPGRSYYLTVSSNITSFDNNDRYYWLGNTTTGHSWTNSSAYSVDPTFDFALQTFGPLTAPLISQSSSYPVDSETFDTLTFSTKVVDTLGPVTVSVSYRVDGGLWTTVAMSSVGNHIYAVNVTSFVENTYVDYFFNATNNRDLVAIDNNDGQYYSIYIPFEVSPEVVISSPADITYKEGDLNNTISWELGSRFPDVYNITIDSTLVVADTAWTNGTVNITVDNLPVGTHTAVIYAFDTFGNGNFDTVKITVTEITEIDDPDAPPSSEVDNTASRPTTTSTINSTTTTTVVTDESGDSPSPTVNGFLWTLSIMGLGILVIIRRRN